jgi:hypothetical protein
MYVPLLAWFEAFTLNSIAGLPDAVSLCRFFSRPSRSK